MLLTFLKKTGLTTIAATLALVLLSPTVSAQDYVVEVHGIVCSFCSIGVTKKVSKLPFVDHTRHKKGVAVDIENQKVTVAVRDDAAIDVAALYAAIESGGYKPVAIWVVGAAGALAPFTP